jgi:hypothetical protein
MRKRWKDLTKGQKAGKIIEYSPILILTLSILYALFVAFGTDDYKIASKITGCPEWILRGIVDTESEGTSGIVGKDGKSIGLCQINESLHAYYVKLFGTEYNVNDDLDSLILAGKLIMYNIKMFDGDLKKGIAAYNQGISGVKKNGAKDAYVNRVFAGRNFEDNSRSFKYMNNMFQTNTERFWNVIYV